MHCVCLWPQIRKRWLVLYSAAFCIILGGLVLPNQYVEDTVGKYMTCAVVSVVCAWSIGVCISLSRKSRSPLLGQKLRWFSLMSVLSMVGCWVATALPLAFEVYLPVSSY